MRRKCKCREKCMDEVRRSIISKDLTDKDLGQGLRRRQIYLGWNKRQRNTHPYKRKTDRELDGLHLPKSDPVLSKLSRKRNEKTYCTSLEEILEIETHPDGQISENELEGGNTRNVRQTSTYIWLPNLVTITQTKTNYLSMPTENGTQNHPCHTTRSSTMRRLKKKHRHERRFQPSTKT